MEGLLDGGVSLIAEAAFQHKLWSARLEPLMQKARIVMLICQPGDDYTAYERYLMRREQNPERVYFHGDDGDAMQKPPAYDPPHMDVETIHVDTTDGYSPTLEEILGMILKTPCGNNQKPI